MFDTEILQAYSGISFKILYKSGVSATFIRITGKRDKQRSRDADHCENARTGGKERSMYRVCL